MNAPSLQVQLLGNPLLLIGTTLFLAAALTASATGAWSAETILIALVFFAPVAAAANQLRRYRQWKREWDAMGGKATPGLTWFGGGKRRVGLALIVYAVIDIGLFYYGSQDGNIVGFVVMTALLVVGLVAAAIGQALSKRTGRKQPSVVYAAVLLRRPGHSPNLGDAYAALPEYCRRLLPPG